MALELRHLRCLIAIVDEGTLTEAGIALGVSQAAVSRTLAALESELGVALIRRTSRQLAVTDVGATVLAHARWVLAEADALVREAQSGHATLRLGYAWSALGRHTLPFQRRWEQMRPQTTSRLVRTNSPTAGLAEGTCPLAVVRTQPDPRRYDSVIVGLERRVCAMAADDPWARRRWIRLVEISGRTLLIDERTGTTTLSMWAEGDRPANEPTNDIDDWLTVIATGRCVGVTAEATVSHYPRRGSSTDRSATPSPSRSGWPGGAANGTRPPTPPSSWRPPCTARPDHTSRTRPAAATGHLVPGQIAGLCSRRGSVGLLLPTSSKTRGGVGAMAAAALSARRNLVR